MQRVAVTNRPEASLAVRFSKSRLEGGRKVWDVFLGREKFSASVGDLYPDVRGFDVNVATFPRSVKSASTRREAFEALREAFRCNAWVERALTMAAGARARGAKVSFLAGGSATSAACEAVAEAVRRMAEKLPNPWMETVRVDLGEIDVVAGVNEFVDENDWRERVDAGRQGVPVEEVATYRPRDTGWGTLYIDGYAIERVRVYGRG
jgi:hypothetical protein